MAKKILPKGQINKRNNQTLETVKRLMEDLGQKYSIKVGILQSNGGAEIVPGTDLSVADLGAVHEFGATINHPGGQPYFINKKTGLAQFVSENSIYGQLLIARKQVTKPHSITIPQRSFLRKTLLSSKGKSEIIDNATALFKGDFELNKIIGEDGIKANSQFVENMATCIGETATLMVINTFSEYKIKPPTKPSSKKHRKYNTNAPTLVDSGQLQTSISYEITKG